MRHLPIRARVFLWVLSAPGLGILGLTLWSLWFGSAPSLTAEQSLIAITVFALVALASLRPVEIRPGEKMILADGAAFAGILMLPAAPALLVAVAGNGIANLVLRRPWYNVLFNLGQRTICAGLSAGAYQFLRGPDSDPLRGVRLALAVLVAACLYSLANSGSVSAMVALTQQRRVWTQWRDVVAQSWLSECSLLATGAAAAVLYRAEPLTTLLLLFPILLIGRSHRYVVELADANRRLEQALWAQRRFVADASHELRNPLTAIRGNLSLLLASGHSSGSRLGPRAKQVALHDADSEASRLSRLVSNLLVLARADEGETIERRPVEIESVLYDIVQSLKPMHPAVTLELAVDESAAAEEVVLSGDEDRLRQLFLNLADNALKFTPPGGHVTIRLGKAGGWAAVGVADTGIGIPPEHIPRIFERFYRVDKGRSRAQGGTGLGLAIAKHIADAHGGRIEVQSTPGVGSTFTVWLPLT